MYSWHLISSPIFVEQNKTLKRQLIRYSDDNIFALFERIGKHSGFPVSSHSHYKQIKIDSSIWPNICYQLGFDSGSLEAALLDVKQRIAQDLTPSVFMCSPDSLAADVVESLRKSASGNALWSAMSLETDSWNQDEESFSNIEISKVNSEKDLLEWCRVANRSLTGEAGIHPELFLRLHSDPDFGFFLEKADGVPAATCMTFSRGEKSGLYLVATLEHFRKNGLGRVMTKYVIRHLKELGIKEIHLQATPSGEQIYEKLGFVKYGYIEVFNLR